MLLRKGPIHLDGLKASSDPSAKEQKAGKGHKVLFPIRRGICGEGATGKYKLDHRSG